MSGMQMQQCNATVPPYMWFMALWRMDNVNTAVCSATPFTRCENTVSVLLPTAVTRRTSKAQISIFPIEMGPFGEAQASGVG
eukprot:scaffold42262_cov27-Tisochrysis_lutea.AAC.1